MNKTLSSLLRPSFDHYRSIGELARTLQHLTGSSMSYRDSGRWGDSGPTEELIGYGGCTNSSTKHWHSGRISSSSGHGNITTWQQNHDSLYNCILASLCRTDGAFGRWQKAHRIHLHMLLKFPMAYQHSDEEQKAWAGFMGLHKHVLNVSTLNSCHKRVNVLCAPELIVCADAVKLKVCVTDKAELRGGPCYSRWDFAFLTEVPEPRWRCQRETFAAFLIQGTKFFRDYKQIPRRVREQPQRR